MYDSQSKTRIGVSLPGVRDVRRASVIRRAAHGSKVVQYLNGIDDQSRLRRLAVNVAMVKMEYNHSLTSNTTSDVVQCRLLLCDSIKPFVKTSGKYLL